jgi:hypothetical protein
MKIYAFASKPSLMIQLKIILTSIDHKCSIYDHHLKNKKHVNNNTAIEIWQRWRNQYKLRIDTTLQYRLWLIDW